MRFAVGIDPGLRGGVSIFDITDNTLKCFATPINIGATKTTKPTRGKNKGKTIKKKAKDTYNIEEMSLIIDSVPFDDTFPVFIEKVGAMPNQGVTSMYNFGYGVGLWHGIITSLGLDFELILPQRWKKHHNLIGDTKNQSREKATELFPQCKESWRLVKHDGIAESALIATYALNSREINISDPSIANWGVIR